MTITIVERYARIRSDRRGVMLKSLRQVRAMGLKIADDDYETTPCLKAIQHGPFFQEDTAANLLVAGYSPSECRVYAGHS